MTIKRPKNQDPLRESFIKVRRYKKIFRELQICIPNVNVAFGLVEYLYIFPFLNCM